MKRLWTPEEEADLKKIYKTMTAKQLAEHFGGSVHAIQVKCFHLGLKKGYDHAKIRLSFDDKLWLRLNFPHIRNELCAMRLGVSLRTVVRLARSMRLEKNTAIHEGVSGFYFSEGSGKPHSQWHLSGKRLLFSKSSER